MKMLVMKADKRYIYGAVDGRFVKMKSKGAQIGDLVEYSPDGRTSLLRTMMAAAACFIILLAAGGAAYSYPVMVIDVDINPSVEIGTNLFERVVAVQGNNPDGEAFVENMDVMHQNVDQALERLLQKAEQEGYIAAEYDDNGVCISIYSDNANRALAFEKKAKGVLAKREDLFDIPTDLMIAKGNSSNLKVAKSEGISMAKADLIQKVIETTPEVTKEMLKDKPIFVLKKMSAADIPPETKAEIVKMIRENKEKITRKKADEIERQTGDENRAGENNKAVQQPAAGESESQNGVDSGPSPSPAPKARTNRPRQKNGDNIEQTPAPTASPEEGTAKNREIEPPVKKNPKRGIIKRIPGIRQRTQEPEKDLQTEETE